MLGHREDARDATQEVLIRVVTRLSSFRGQGRLTTWAYRITANYLVDLSRRPREAITFEQFEGALAQEPNAIAPELLSRMMAEELVEETFLGCTLALLRCLDREHRLAFILGAILELSSHEAAQVLSISAPAFRKRLSRARRRLEDFMRPRCGVMNPDAPCRCAHQVNHNVARGLLDPERLHLAGRGEPRQARAHVREIRGIVDSIELFRRHPDYAAPEGLVEGLRRILGGAALQ